MFWHAQVVREFTRRKCLIANPFAKSRNLASLSLSAGESPFAATTVARATPAAAVFLGAAHPTGARAISQVKRIPSSG